MILLKISGICVTSVLFLMSFFAQFMRTSWFDYLIFTLPSSTVFVFCTYYGCRSNFFHAYYFNLICLYLTLKMKRLNASLTEKMSTHSLERKLNRIDAHFKLILGYNRELWSKVITLMIIVYSGVTVFTLYLALFSRMGIFINLGYAQFTAAAFLIVSMFILSASSLSCEINETYKILNHINVKYQVKSMLVKLKV